MLSIFKGALGQEWSMPTLSYFNIYLATFKNYYKNLALIRLQGYQLPILCEFSKCFCFPIPLKWYLKISSLSPVIFTYKLVWSSLQLGFQSKCLCLLLSLDPMHFVHHEIWVHIFIYSTVIFVKHLLCQLLSQALWAPVLIKILF